MREANRGIRERGSQKKRVGNPSLVYPIAYDLGQWYEMTGKEREAAVSYARAKSAIEHMVTAVEDDAMCSTLLHSALVQEIHKHAERLS